MLSQSQQSRRNRGLYHPAGDSEVSDRALVNKAKFKFIDTQGILILGQTTTIFAPIYKLPPAFFTVDRHLKFADINSEPTVSTHFVDPPANYKYLALT